MITISVNILRFLGRIADRVEPRQFRDSLPRQPVTEHGPVGDKGHGRGVAIEAFCCVVALDLMPAIAVVEDPPAFGEGRTLIVARPILASEGLAPSPAP
jgi:hypothetical protein